MKSKDQSVVICRILNWNRCNILISDYTYTFWCDNKRSYFIGTYKIFLLFFHINSNLHWMEYIIRQCNEQWNAHLPFFSFSTIISISFSRHLTSRGVHWRDNYYVLNVPNISNFLVRLYLLLLLNRV